MEKTMPAGDDTKNLPLKGYDSIWEVPAFLV